LGNPPAGRNYKIIKHVKVTERICLDYTNSYDVGPLIRKVMEENEADAMSNVTWKAKQSLGSGTLNVVTLGIASCKDIELEGDLIKFVGE